MKEKVILGVCLWLSERMDINLTGLRIVFVLAVLFGFRFPLFSLSPVALYLILYLLKPKND